MNKAEADRKAVTEQVCAIEGCDRPCRSRGLCGLHYERQRVRGETDPVQTPQRKCAVEGCDRDHFAHGYCPKHYARWKKWGDPLKVGWKGKARTPLDVRLWSRVDRSGGPDACWPWTGRAVHNFGYGNIGDENGRNENTHRVAWRLTYGPIPKGMCILHDCDNAACCNPAHLSLGTQTENLSDMTKRGRRSPVRAKGERQWCAKLTEPQVREIRALRVQGVGVTELSRRYDVSVSGIKAIVNRRTWKHVE